MEDEINYLKITNEVKRNKYGSECKEFMGIPFSAVPFVSLAIRDNVGFTMSLHMSTTTRLWNILIHRLCNTHVFKFLRVHFT